jgi:hypothetical protein
MCQPRLYHSNRIAHPTTSVRKRNSSWLTIFLLIVIVTVPVVGQDPLLMVPIHSRPAGCHQHGNPAPRPQPVSYRCCQSGHDSAILQSSAASQLDSFGLTVPAARGQIFVPASRVRSHGDVGPSSTDPPDLTPLRV